MAEHPRPAGQQVIGRVGVHCHTDSAFCELLTRHFLLSFENILWRSTHLQFIEYCAAETESVVS